jgi:cyclohexanone monooxygenase
MAPEQAKAELDRGWEAGGISGFVVPFAGYLANPEDNAVHSEYVKSKIREIVHDPETAEMLIPDHPFFAKRPVFGSGYYEAFNRENVRLVDTQADPIASFSEKGLVLDSGREIELDVVVAALGFENLGALNRIDIRGRYGRKLRDAWADEGPSTYLGLQVVDFPNMFMIFGPGGSGGLNVFAGMELISRFIKDCLDHMRSKGLATVEPSREAQDGWVERVRAAGDAIPLITDNAPSWQRFGGGKAGSPVHLVYWGTWSSYADAYEAAMEAGYPEFEFTPARFPVVS